MLEPSTGGLGHQRGHPRGQGGGLHLRKAHY